jgi:hypothetical protein
LLLRQFALAVILLSAQGSCALAQSPRPAPGTEKEPDAIATQRAFESIATELRAIRDQIASEKPGPPLWSNWVLIVVTFGAVIAAFRTLDQLRRQVGSNATAADAAKKSADVAETTMRLSHSPLVFCERIDIIHVAVGERPAIVVHFMNAGSSAATQCWLTVAFQFFDGPTGPIPDQCISTLDPKIGTRQGPFSIAGGQRIYLPVAKGSAITEEEMSAMNAGQKRLWAFGAGQFFDPIAQETIRFPYAARYIVFGWDQPRPKFPSDFWIFNDFGTSGYAARPGA